MMYLSSSSLDARQDIYSFSSGARWNLLKKPVTPFIGFELLASHFAKKKITAITDSAVIVIGSSAKNKFGAMVIGGVGIRLSNILGFEIEGGYAADNLFSRKKNEKTAERYAVQLHLVYSLKP
ncbi:MAG: hypothetical protein PHW79_09765 [Candidatus Marinimicrobia bacterium]|nr:hypothetical protein [Candidatus Neomarinimicrobiota bacterium]